MTARFCPRCHRLVPLPDFLRSGKVRVEGAITIGCGNCRKGKVVLTAADLPVAVEEPEGPGDLDALRERETGLPEWVKCVSIDPDVPMAVYCGRDLGMFGEFTFQGMEHARNSLARGNRIVPHPMCLDCGHEPELAAQARTIWKPRWVLSIPRTNGKGSEHIDVESAEAGRDLIGKREHDEQWTIPGWRLREVDADWSCDGRDGCDLLAEVPA